MSGPALSDDEINSIGEHEVPHDYHCLRAFARAVIEAYEKKRGEHAKGAKCNCCCCPHRDKSDD